MVRQQLGPASTFRMRLVPQDDVNRLLTLASGRGLLQPNFALDAYFPQIESAPPLQGRNTIIKTLKLKK